MARVLIACLAFVWAMCCSASIVLAQATPVITDGQSIINGLPISEHWKQIALIIFGFVVACRWIAEALYGMSNAMAKPEMGKVAVGIYKAIRAFAALFGYFGIGMPSDLVSARIDAAIKAQADANAKAK